jgi:serine protease Do
VRPGDIIVGFNGTAIDDGGVLLRLVQDAAIGSTATVDVIRDGRRIQLRVPIVRATEQ